MTSTWAVGFVMFSLFAISTENACVNVTGCNGCGTTSIDCTAAGLTEFPRFSADDIVLVENLILSVNHLTAISVLDLQPFTQLQELDLSINDIVHIEESSFVTDLSMISLAENPLHCDCGLRWLLNYLDYLPSESDVDAGTCGSPHILTGTSLITLNNSQLICECVPECGMNSSCDLSTGTCECNPGYTGDNCSQECFPGNYGLNCSKDCTCEAGSCDHVTGVCTCLPGYHGVNCTHDCSGAPGCAVLGREKCSLNTPENSCGPCHELSSYIETEWLESGNSSCIYYTVLGTVLQIPTLPTMYNPSLSLSSGAVIQSLTFSSTHNPGSYAVSAAVTPVTELDNVDSQPHITSNQLIIILTCTGFLVILLTVNLMIVSIGIIYWKHAHRQRRRRISPLYSDKKTSQVLESIAMHSNTLTV